MGILGGFATMIGSVAGSVLAIYLQALHLPKNNFIGAVAWFFMIINLTKFPLQMFVWNNITLQTLSVDLLAIKAIILAAIVGIWVVRIIPAKYITDL
jgi:uncharacterized membrane protein YfcA